MNVSSSYRLARPELVSGKNIMILDDVLTTGSTLKTLSGLLLQHGAATVTCVIIAKSQSISTSIPYRSIPCPYCQKPMRLRWNPNSQRLFYGCSEYTKHNPRSITYDILRGLGMVSEINSNTSFELYDDSETY